MSARFTFLGRTTLARDGAAPTVVSSGQVALVLGRLVLEHPRVLTSDALVDLLWPDGPPPSFAGLARRALARARRALVDAGESPNCLQSLHGVVSLTLAPGVTVDVAVARRAAQEAESAAAARRWDDALAACEIALDLLGQPLLPNVEGPWVRQWRKRLADEERRVALTAGRASIAIGRADVAAARAAAVLDRDPLDEGATRLLMGAELARGNRGASLGAYERLRVRLDDVLGVRPSEQTELRFVELLGDPPLPGTLDHRFASGDPFVGREEDMAALRSEWERACGGEARVVFIGGPPGIGKTRLATEMLDGVAHDGNLTLLARCDTGDPPFAPFLGLIDQVAARSPEAADKLRALGVSSPALASLAGHSAHDEPPAAFDVRRSHLFARVVAALTAGATRPCAILLDDLQRAGTDTLSLLVHVVDRLAGLPCLLLVTVREPPAPVAGAMAELARRAPTSRVEVVGLSPAHVAELVERTGVPTNDDRREVARILVERTAGSPLYVTSLIRTALASGETLDPRAIPPAVADLITNQVHSLPRDAVSVLVAAAIAGQEFDLAVLETCLSLGRDIALDIVEDLCGRHLLREVGTGRFRFTHALVRDAVLSTVGATRKARLHARTADALREAGAPSSLVAAHYAEAGNRVLAADWGIRAGEDDLRVGAWANAYEHFRASLLLADDDAVRVDAMTGLGRAQRALGNAFEARQTLERALTSARGQGRPRAVALATLGLVGGGGRGVALDVGDLERADYLRAALAGLGGDHEDLAVPLMAELALALVLTDRKAERDELCDACVERARRWGHARGLAIALNARRIPLMGPTGTEARVADAREVLALPANEVPPDATLAAQLALVEDLIELGDRHSVDDAIACADALATRLHHPYWSWATACWQTLLRVVDGHLDDAEALAFDAVSRQTPSDHPEAIAALGVQLVNIRLLQGRAAEMVDLLASAVEENPHVPAYRAVLALCALEAGDRARGLDAYRFFAASGFALPPDSNWLLAVAVLADTAATLRDRDGAPALAALLAPWAGRHVVLNCYGGGGAYWGPVAHHLGRLAALQGERPLARRLLVKAVAEAEAFGATAFADRAQEALRAVR